MRKAHRTILAVALLSSLAVLSVQAQDNEAADSIIKLADQISRKNREDPTKAGEGITKDAEAVAKKHELIDIMTLMKLRRPGVKTGGLGVGAVPGATRPDGIEAHIIMLTKKELPADLPPRQRGELLHLAEVTAAIAATAMHQCPDPKRLNDWKKWTKDMYNASQDLSKALQAKNPAQVKQAAMNLNKSCVDCHTVIRD